MDKLRMRFSKTGRAVYISHLDLMHTIQRAFSRAGYKVKYSEGFNPHPVISIALPLSVGMSSICEIMDFRLEGECDFSETPAKLNAALPEGIEVFEIYEAEEKPAALKWLKVEGVFRYNDAPELDRIRNFFSQDQIVISKKTKRGVSDTDIVPGIREISFDSSGNDITVHAVVSAQEPTLNPELLAEALRQLAPELAPVFSSFRRTEVYNDSMKVFR
ncbi:MAG: TIGR03936 family radical SAM-associated protein [Eubacteriales bacterium]|nr:TIGR03936 family radical SAM-associated protein [Eubacteriales bacterium]